MPTAITLTPRLLYKEDLDRTVNPVPQTVQTTVLGSGAGPATVTKIDAVFYSAFTIAANDVAAAAAGVDVGVIYVTSGGQLRCRLS